MSVDASNNLAARGILYASLAALGYIAWVLVWLGVDLVQSHPSGPIRFEVIGLMFVVLFGPGTFSLLASAITYGVKRTFPTFLQVSALLSAVWVAYMYTALEAL
ncbi:hypothetical protein [Ruegeria atlantica]|uniref:hypothetical protein n=1 Tax=Ruegeria atlantica TaxID=81569 RepID=UPI00147BC8EB|nr:hypothetical protein [Ruegeria atlantica]